MSAENEGRKRSAEGRWKAGISGNPAGRPSGSRNKSTTFFEELLNGQGEGLIQKAIELALHGDTRALSICWDRLLPPRRERTITFALPAGPDANSVGAALAAVVSGAAEGRITPGEAECLARVLETQMRVVEFETLAQRVAKLEQSNSRTPQTDQSANDASLDWVARNYSNSGNCGNPPNAKDPENGVKEQ